MDSEYDGFKKRIKEAIYDVVVDEFGDNEKSVHVVERLIARIFEHGK